MRLSALLLLAVPMFGQNTGTCASPFTAAMAPGGQLAMDIRSGDIDIVGTPAASVRVTCRLRDLDRLSEVKIRLAANHLRVSGGPDKDFRIRIEVPNRLGLLVRSPAGDMTISGITGDKDVELHAGDLTIHIERPEDYKIAEGSVLAGDLNASAFGIVKDGLFRSFRKDNAGGQYRLHAKLLAGDLTLK